MARLYILLFFSITFQISFAQSEWQEYFAYDNRSYSHLGHYVTDEAFTLLMGNETVPMNTLETITGKTTRTQEVIRDYFTFETKTTRTGIDSKEILLINPFDYDISGYGAYSIHKTDDDFDIKNIQGETQPYDYIHINDAYMLGESLDSKECIAGGTRYFFTADDEIYDEIDLDGSFAYHPGLNGEAYQISNGEFRSLYLPLNGTIDLGNFDKLYNNPYQNQLIELEGNTINRYSYTDLSFLSSSILMSEPNDIQFVEDGFYYLTESEASYIVFYYSDDNSDSELFYELPKTDEIETFNIRNIEVIGDDVYFIGIFASPLVKERFSYIQKRTINKDFTPVRKDIELVSASATREPITEYENEYKYKFTVKNLSDDTIYHFTAYSELYFDFGPDQYAQTNASLILPPGESFEVNGQFIHYGFDLSKLTFSIPGVDFGFDSDESNNTYTADVISLSNKETELKQFDLSPNLSSDLIFIKGNLSEIESITITDITGQNLVMPKNMNGQIDISYLPKGQFWLEVKTKSRIEQHPFMKI